MRESRMCEPRIDGNWNTARRDEHDHRDFSSVAVKFPIFSFLFFPLFFFSAERLVKETRRNRYNNTGYIHTRSEFCTFRIRKKKKINFENVIEISFFYTRSSNSATVYHFR